MRPVMFFNASIALSVVFCTGCSDNSNPAPLDDSYDAFAAELSNMKASNEDEYRRSCNYSRKSGQSGNATDDIAAEMRRFERHVNARKPTPEVEARKAGDRGDFRFIAHNNGPIRGIYMSASGVVCRPPIGSWDRMTIRWSFPSPSDVLPFPGHHPDKGRDSTPKRHLNPDFARRYNLSLLGHPRFPYGDICRAGLDISQPHYAPAALINQLGFRDLRVTESPIDLHEAARRGTIESLGSLLAASSPREINRRDMFGMTALAWAVAYARPDHMRLLLGAQADPRGSGCSHQDQLFSPLDLAIRMKRGDLVALLRPYLRNRRLLQGDLPASLNRPASDENFINAAAAAPGQMRFQMRISRGGQVTACTMVPNPSRTATEASVGRELCQQAMAQLRFFPAIDQDRRPIDSDAIVRFTSY